MHNYIGGVLFDLCILLVEVKSVTIPIYTYVPVVFLPRCVAPRVFLRTYMYLRMCMYMCIIR